MTPYEFPSAIAFAFQAAGGISAAAKACERTYQALNKWRQSACLPRTDYTGETNYAERLSEAAKDRGYPFDPAWLKEESSPLKNKPERKKAANGRPVPPGTHHHSAVGSR